MKWELRVTWHFSTSTETITDVVGWFKTKYDAEICGKFLQSISKNKDYAVHQVEEG